MIWREIMWVVGPIAVMIILLFLIYRANAEEAVA
jgi:hypothetical protein